MRSLPLSARLFVWCVILSGVALLLLVTPSIPFSKTHSLVTSMILTVIFGIVDIYRVRLPYNAENSVSMAVGFGMVLLFGPGLACWAVAAACCLTDLYLKKPWYKALFNSANAVLSFGLAGLAYQSLYDGSTFFLGSARNIAVLLLAMAICLLVNTLGVSTIIGLLDHQSPWRVWCANYEGVLLQLLTLAPLGSLIAMAYSLTPPYGLGLILLFLPLGAVYYSFRSYQQLRDQTRYTIEALAEAVDRRDPYTFQHSQRVKGYVEKIAGRLNLSPGEMESIVWAASIHDLGKIDVPEEILSKPGPLEDDEWKIIRKHSAVGADIVDRISFHPTARGIIRHHHEWFDGSGYPNGVSGDRIPVGARILAVADAFEAMTSDRPYRPALSYRAAVAELEAGRGTQFDPVIVDTFLTILEEEPTFKPVKAKARGLA
jgi:putative nucleotidyltransferase with HDIG domain